MATLTLFGKPWRSDEWTAQDDSVRGGESSSVMDIATDGKYSAFSGMVDSKTLGGAGFASQRTTHHVNPWDLSQFDGIVLVCCGGQSGKRYTVVLKDTIPSKNQDQSTISWEYTFTPPPSPAPPSKSDHLSNKFKIHATFDEFQPTYRGRPVSPKEKLDLKNVKRMSFMVRSFFGAEKQEGKFSLTICSVEAVQNGSRETDALLGGVLINEFKTTESYATGCLCSCAFM